MFSPHTIVYHGRRLLVTRHEGGDYHHGTPLGERLNLLRYSLTIRPGAPDRWTINANGRLALRWANLNWVLWRKYLPRKRAR
jgi:hypothetical protein